VVAPRLLLDSELEISTQRSIGGSLWTNCAPLRGAEVALAEADREGVVERGADELFVGFGELAVALLRGAAVVATLLGDLAGVAFGAALAFGVAVAAGLSEVGCAFVVLVDFVVLVGVGVGDGDVLGVADEVGDADAVADGEELGVEDAAGVGEELGVDEAAGDGVELGVGDAVGFAGAVEVLAVLGFADVAGVLEVLGDGDAVGFGDLPDVEEELGALVCLTLPPAPPRPSVLPGLMLVVALADGVGVVDAVAGGSVVVAVGVGVGVDDVDVDVCVAVGVGVGVGDEVGGGSVALSGWHDWSPAVVAASSAAMA
jgi:hypothetical protein